MTQPSLGELYLTQRGVNLETATKYGVQIELSPSAARIIDRLGKDMMIGEKRLSELVIEMLWFPIRDERAALKSWLARPLPTIPEGPKFLSAFDSTGPPFIPKQVWEARKRIDTSIVITEGPVKGSVLCQAGALSIALNGVWMGASKNGDGKYGLRQELLEFQWLGRRVYLCFDADQSANPDVLQALIRTFFALNGAGALVFQLTTWPISEGKGIDDYLVGKAGTDPTKQKEYLDALINGAQPFFSTLRPFMLPLVEKELERVAMSPAQRSQLCKQLAGPLEVRGSVLEEGNFSAADKSKPELSFAANYEPWPESVNAEQLFGEVMLQIRKEAIIDEAQQWVAALEVFLTWVHDKMDFSPILYITGPTRECGKTRLLLAIGKMAKRPLKTSSITSASLFRLSELYHPTFLVDEAQDAFKNDDFCTIMKAGHDPNDVAVRVDTNSWEVKTFDAFCPKVVAGIGRANGQIMSRSITLEMERSVGEVDPSIKATDPLFVEIRRKLARWANDVGDLSRFRLLHQAAKLRGRDNWEVYYRVASGISQYVADQLLKFIPDFVNEEEDFDTYLLTSLRKLYREHDLMEKGGHLGSEMILAALNQDMEGPWYREHRGRESKGLTREKLSARLRRYKVKPEQHWHSDIQQDVRGYFYVHPDEPRNSLKRVFDQYLPAEQ